jgi:hypothetical protein
MNVETILVDRVFLPRQQIHKQRGHARLMEHLSHKVIARAMTAAAAAMGKQDNALGC